MDKEDWKRLSQTPEFDLTVRMVAKKLIKRFSSADLPDLLSRLEKREFTPALTSLVNEAIEEVENETQSALESSGKLVSSTAEKIDGFVIFWYAVAASFVINILSSTLLHVLQQTIPDFTSQRMDWFVILLCLLLLCLISLRLFSTISKFWREGIEKNSTLQHIFKDDLN